MKDADDTLTPELLLAGYAQGIFPMAEHQDDPDIFWVDPSYRGVLPLGGFHVSRSLGKAMRRADYNVTLNRCFADVVRGCADRPETWINSQIFDLYQDLHQIGHAHSLEVWREGNLFGGVYGVSLGAAFFGESMFSRQANGSKLALVHLSDHLERCGFRLFDTQFITDHLSSLGAVEIPRRDYHILLDDALARSADIESVPLATSCYEVWQRMTQTS
jgi:leucyl/phenylalanyl-tRNA--protein transferase